MATRVSDLQNLATITGLETIVVLQDNNNLATMTTGRIRGAGWFWGVGTGVPSTTFGNADWPASYGPYRNGDFFRQETFAGSLVFVLYYWDNTQWIEMANTQPQRFWDNISSATNYDATITAVINAAQFRQGDFYRNLTDNKVYGPYETINGLNFDPDDRGFYYDRGPQAHSSTELGTWNPWDTTVKTDPWYMARNGDTYKQLLTDTNHGGFIWQWNDADYTTDFTANSNVALARQAAWGTRVLSRGPQHTSEAIRPAGPSSFDDTRYITGDTVLARDTLIVWGPYVGGQTDQLTAWPNNSPLAPSEMVILEETEGRYLPPADNSLYQLNDILLWNMTRGFTPTPIMYGYDPARNGGAGGWEFIAYHRAPAILEVFGTTNDALVLLPDDARGGPFVASGSPIVGDTVRMIFRHRGQNVGAGINLNGFTVPDRTGRVEDRVIATIDFNSGAITYEAGFTSPHEFRSHTSGTTVRTFRDDETYTAGDILHTTDGSMFGPYVIGQATNEDAWPVMSIRPDQLFSLTENTMDYTPTPDNALYRSGDYLMYRMTVGAVDLPILFGPYDETANTNTGAWNLLSVLRSNISYDLLSVNSTFAAHADTSAVVYLTGGAPIVGDTLVRIYTDNAGGGPTGKTDERVIASIGAGDGGIAYGPTTNPNFGQKWDSGTDTRTTFDDNIYSNGDILTSDTGIIFGPYLEGQSTDAAAWPLRANRATRVFNVSENTVDFLPVNDNNIYINGDFLIYTMTLGALDLPLMFGPYDTTGNGNTGIWNLSSAMRHHHEFNLAAGNSVFAEYDSADDAMFVNQGMPTVGDTVLLTYTDLTTGLFTGKEATRNIQNVNQTTGAITWGNTINARPSQIWAATGAARDVRDDNVYSDGDFLQTTTGAVFGPYLEGQTDDEIAWPVRTVAPSDQPMLIIRDDASLTFELRVDNNNQLYLEEKA